MRQNVSVVFAKYSLIPNKINDFTRGLRVAFSPRCESLVVSLPDTGQRKGDWSNTNRPYFPSLLAGVLQMLMGAFKMSQWFRAISPAVIQGMLAGIGVLIIGSQIHVMVDDSLQGSGLKNLFSIPEAIYKGIFPLDVSSHHVAAAVGLVTITLIFA